MTGKTPLAGPGRPPSTSARALEVIALRRFAAQGFDATTVEEIASEAGVSRRTFFRYFESKASVLWSDFDHEVSAIRDALADVPDDVPVMEAVRRAVIEANHYRAEDAPELLARMSLIGSVPELVASAAVHYDAWERSVSDFVARRIGRPADSLYPLAVGRATLATCRAAYDQWVDRADTDLTTYLDTALRALAAGFSDQALTTGQGMPPSTRIVAPEV